MEKKNILKLFSQGISLWVQNDKLKISAPKNLLNEEKLDLIKLNRDKIIAALSEWRINRHVWPLSHGQQLLWNYQQINTDSSNYNIVFSGKLSGDFNRDYLISTLNDLFQQHEILRTKIISIESAFPLQYFDEINNIDIAEKQVEDWSESDVKKWVNRESDRPFNLKNQFLIRFYLLKNTYSYNEEPKTVYYFTIVAHHIISDLQSFQIALNDISNIYSCYKNKNKQELKSKVNNYSEYIADEIIWLNSRSARNDIDYWKNKLAPPITNIELPTGVPIEHNENEYESHVEIELGEGLTSTLRSMSKRLGVTPFMALLSILKVLVYKHTGVNDIVIGTPFTKRLSPGFEKMLGDFANPIAIRTSMPPKIKFCDFANYVKSALLEAIEHGNCPFSSVVDSLNLKRNLNDNPLIQIALIWDKIDSGFNAQNDELFSGSPIISEQRGAPFDLTFTAIEYNNNIFLRGSCNNTKYKKNAVATYLKRFKVLIDSISQDPFQDIFKYKCNTENDYKFLNDFSGKVSSTKNNNCLLSKIRAQSKTTPNATAVAFESKKLTYELLIERTDYVARKISSLKGGSFQNIGLMFTRSLDICPAILGIWKTGATYIPIDPQYPKQRIEFLLDDSSIDCIITNIELPQWLVDRGIRILNICKNDTISELSALRNMPDTKNKIAYISYTSGTTGSPKGVMVDNQGLFHLIESMQEVLNLKPSDNWLAVTTLSFDISIAELILPLTAGACVTIASDEERVNPILLAELIHRENISVMQATPTTWQMMIDSSWIPEKNLTLISGGESLPEPLLKALLRSADRVFNFYGPTETTVWSSFTVLDRTPSGNIIGKPLSNSSIYILDQNLNQVSPGSSGEIYISGASVALGYKNRPDLSAACFLPNPFYSNSDLFNRMYRTGDIGRHTPDGQIEFLGRNDSQIKLDGHRIEINEIENCLRSQPNIQEAAVHVISDINNRKQLVAAYSRFPSDKKIGKTKFSLYYFGANAERYTDKYKLYLEGAKYADTHGLEGVWTPERHFNEVGGLFPNPAVTSAGIATITNHIKIRSGSVVVPLHNPIRIAEEWAVVDNLSGGRVELAVASGWVPRDFALNPDNYADRKKHLQDGIDKIYKIWRGKNIEERGGDGSDHNIKIYPTPVQSNIPLWLTVTSDPQGYKNAGKMGVGVVTHLLTQSLDVLADNVKLYYEAFNSSKENACRQPRVAIMLHTYLGEDLEQTLSEAKEPFKDYMRSHIGLLSSWAKSNEMDFDLNDPESVSTLTEHAFKRYTNNASLIGTTMSVLPLVERLQDIGITEIACLIDWIDPKKAISGLPFINALMRETHKQREIEEYRLLIKKQVTEQLPKYMVPSIWVELDELPKTPNGKIDRKKIQSLDIGDNRAGKRTIIPPSNDIQTELLSIWRKAFGIDQISVDDDFFDLGGNSLTAAQVISDVRKNLHMDIPIRIIFESTTILDLSEAIEKLNITTDINPITKVSNSEFYDVSAAQKRLALLYKIDPSSSAYNVTAIIPQHNQVSDEAVKFAISKVTSRHEILRTSFIFKDDEIYQKVGETNQFKLDTYITPSDEELDSLISSYLSKPFDLTKPPLFRACLVETYDNKKLLLWCMHEIVADGYSSILLERELTAYAKAYLAGDKFELPESTIQYKDYAAWHNIQLESDTMINSGTYWKNVLSGELPRPVLPFDFSPSSSRKLEGSEYTQVIDRGSSKSIIDYLNTHKVTLFSFMHGVLSAFLHRLSGQQDIIVGSPILGRDHRDLQKVVGFFLNTVLIRSSVNPTDSFANHITNTKQTVIQSLEHQTYPFDKLIEELSLPRERNFFPVTSVFLNVINYDALNSNAHKPEPGHHRLFNNIRVELEIYIQQVNEKIYLRSHYRSSLFHSETIEYLINELIYMIKQVVEFPDKTICEYLVFEKSRRNVKINSPYLEFLE